MRPLQVRPHETAVPQRRVEAFVPQQPPYLIEPGPTAQPGSRREVPERMRMQSAMIEQARFAAEAVEYLHKVPILQRPAGALRSRRATTGTP